MRLIRSMFVSGRMRGETLLASEGQSSSCHIPSLTLTLLAWGQLLRRRTFPKSSPRETKNPRDNSGTTFRQVESAKPPIGMCITVTMATPLTPALMGTQHVRPTWKLSSYTHILGRTLQRWTPQLKVIGYQGTTRSPALCILLLQLRGSGWMPTSTATLMGTTWSRGNTSIPCNTTGMAIQTLCLKPASMGMMWQSTATIMSAVMDLI